MSEPVRESSFNIPDDLKEISTVSLTDEKSHIKDESPNLSKNQQKRLIREARRKESKPEWRKLQKAKRKLKEQAKKEDYISKGLEYPLKKRIKTDLSKEKTGKVIFDLSFDGIMVSREVKSLFSQIMRCYSANRRSNSPFNLEVSSFSGEISERFKETYSEYDRWDVAFNSEHFISTEQDKEKIIYLTPDSDVVLESIKSDHIYVIGGIVDKNRFKGRTLESATELNIKTARLPVPEFIDLKTSPVLTIYHVLEIMLKYKDCHDWKEALESFVPKRNMKDDSEIIDANGEDE